MSYPWWMFTVWFADGYDDVYDATGLDTTEAMLELLKAFDGENEELKADARTHGGVVRVQFEQQQTVEVDAAERAADLSRNMQSDINRILKPHDLLN